MWICIVVSFAVWHNFLSMLYRRDRALEVAPEVVDWQHFTSFEAYLQNMSRPSTWGDELTLQASACLLLAPIRVLSDSDLEPERRFTPPPTIAPGEWNRIMPRWCKSLRSHSASGWRPGQCWGRPEADQVGAIKKSLTPHLIAFPLWMLHRLAHLEPILYRFSCPHAGSQRGR